MIGQINCLSRLNAMYITDLYLFQQLKTDPHLRALPHSTAWQELISSRRYLHHLHHPLSNHLQPIRLAAHHPVVIVPLSKPIKKWAHHHSCLPNRWSQKSSKPNQCPMMNEVKSGTHHHTTKSTSKQRQRKRCDEKKMIVAAKKAASNSSWSTKPWKRHYPHHTNRPSSAPASRSSHPRIRRHLMVKAPVHPNSAGSDQKHENHNEIAALQAKTHCHDAWK